MGYIDAAHLHYTLPGGRVLLEDASFRVGEGAHVALVGANGTGKTTLLRLAAGDLRPDSGTIVAASRPACRSCCWRSAAPPCCCSTSRPTTSTSPRPRRSRRDWPPTRGPSWPSPMTAGSCGPSTASSSSRATSGSPSSSSPPCPEQARPTSALPGVEQLGGGFGGQPVAQRDQPLGAGAEVGEAVALQGDLLCLRAVGQVERCAHQPHVVLEHGHDVRGGRAGQAEAGKLVCEPAVGVADVE